MYNSKTIALVHPSLNSFGGAEWLVISALRSLKREGYRTCLITLEKTKWNHVEKLCGRIPKVDYEIVYPHLSLPMTYEPKHWKWIERSLYRVFRSLKGENYLDLVINTHPETLYVDADILYVHDPHMLLQGIMPTKASKSPLVWIYQKSCRSILNKLREDFKVKTVLTNSSYGKAFLSENWAIDAVVVFPPVDVDLYKTILHAEHCEPWVVTISRFSPSKNLEMIPEIAAGVPGAKFFVLGSASQRDRHVLMELKTKSRDLCVEDRIVLMPDASLTEKLEIMQRAQVYLHTTLNEGFGIAIVEAMAAGLGPVVHKSGGPWIDIFEKNKKIYGYAFETAEEAAQDVTNILNSKALRQNLTEAVAERAQGFSVVRFRSRMASIVSELLSNSPQG